MGMDIFPNVIFYWEDQADFREAYLGLCLMLEVMETSK